MDESRVRACVEKLSFASAGSLSYKHSSLRVCSYAIGGSKVGWLVLVALKSCPLFWTPKLEAWPGSRTDSSHTSCLSGSLSAGRNVFGRQIEYFVKAPHYSC